MLCPTFWLLKTISLGTKLDQASSETSWIRVHIASTIEPGHPRCSAEIYGSLEVGGRMIENHRLHLMYVYIYNIYICIPYLSMYGIFTYIYHVPFFKKNVGKSTIHGSYGYIFYIYPGSPAHQTKWLVIKMIGGSRIPDPTNGQSLVCGLPGCIDVHIYTYIYIYVLYSIQLVVSTHLKNISQIGNLP